MKLTKDEARILGDMMRDGKFTTNSYQVIPGLMNALTHLEKKLIAFGEDSRRSGRTSQDTLTDCLKRVVKKQQLSENN